MPRLKNRNKQIPNGFVYYCPYHKWKPLPWSSFEVVCAGLRSVRKANPGITKANNLSTDPAVIAEQVDAYNVAHCQAMGWYDYITDAPGGAPPAAPFPPGHPLHAHQQKQIGLQTRLAQKLGNVAGGANTLVEWLADGAEAVPQEQANKRAAVCAICPKNLVREWAALFTVPAANAIRATLGLKREMKLETPSDHLLGTCTACDCVNSLKVWLPFEKFYLKMSQAAKDDLNKENPTCWIIQETPK
jgi:hypothetical protein